MEQNDEKLITILRERSYMACITTGIREAFCHFGLLLRYSWPSLIPATILPFPFAAFFYGQLDAILQKWAELRYVPDVRFKALKGQAVERSVRELMLMGIMICLIGALTSGCWALSHFGLPTWSYLIAVLLAYLLLIPFTAVAFEISFSQKPVKECLGSYVTGMKNYGNLLAFNILISILTTTMQLIGCLPLFVVGYVAIQGYIAESAGDTVYLPTLFPALLALAYLISIFANMMSAIMAKFCQCLYWGSMTATAEAKQKETEESETVM